MDNKYNWLTRRFCSPKEFARVFGLSPKTIASLAKKGTIRSVVTEGVARRLIPIEEIERFASTLKPCSDNLRPGGKRS